METEFGAFVHTVEALVLMDEQVLQWRDKYDDMQYNISRVQHQLHSSLRHPDPKPLCPSSNGQHDKVIRRFQKRATSTCSNSWGGDDFSFTVEELQRELEELLKTHEQAKQELDKRWQDLDKWQKSFNGLCDEYDRVKSDYQQFIKEKQDKYSAKLHAVAFAISAVIAIIVWISVSVIRTSFQEATYIAGVVYAFCHAGIYFVGSLYAPQSSLFSN